MCCIFVKKCLIDKKNVHLSVKKTRFFSVLGVKLQK